MLALRTPDLSTRWWLFSPRADVAVFLGSALLSFLALAVGMHLGLLDADTPEWAWIPAVLLVDVAHVWSTGFRVYFEPAEVRRRPGLYLGTPAGALLVGVMLYSLGSMVFWRVLAYLAVWHFVRQQYGWVALYRAKVGETAPLGRWIDTLAIYAATVYPLIEWHAHLPRRFWWFVPQDFGSLPQLAAAVAAPLYGLIMGAYLVRAVASYAGYGRPNPGRDMVVVTTALCWYVGIVALNSDYAFTVTNVLIHGIPYMALVYFYARRDSATGPAARLARNPLPFLLTLWALAYAEEMFWDRSIWHERGWLFGGGWEVGGWDALLVPLLAVPQITHYVLDGFIWRRRSNPGLQEAVVSGSATSGTP